MEPAEPASRTASGLLGRLAESLDTRDQRVLDAWPLERYVALLDLYPEMGRLGYRSPEVAKACEEIRAMVGDAGLEVYHQALMVALIIRSTKLLPQRGLPEDVVRLYEQNFTRILGQIESDIGSSNPKFYLHPFSAFSKDLCLCTLRLIPAGVEKVHMYRLPRRMFLKGGLWGGLAALRFVLLDQRGLGPFYEMHLHSEDPAALRAFTPDGWTAYYMQVAELLRRDPRIKGVIGTAWFFDPALASISPHLVYTRTMVTENGGRLFFMGECDADGVKDATFKSGTRRRLYEQGTYVPKNYMVVWPRTELITWAEKALRPPEGQV